MIHSPPLFYRLFRTLGFGAAKYLCAAAAAMPIMGPLARIAEAAPITEYRSEASFLAVFPPAEPRQFDNSLADLGPFWPGELTTNSRVYAGNGFAYDISTTGYALYVAGSAAEPWLTSVDARPPLVVANISGPPAGQFGIGGQFFLSDENGDWASGSLSVAATLSGGGIFSTTLSSPSASDFFGLVANRPITSLSLTSLSTGLYPTIGGVVVIVPEPWGFSLVAVASSCLLLIRRATPANCK
jgi:hypothetical protein